MARNSRSKPSRIPQIRIPEPTIRRCGSDGIEIVDLNCAAD